jgi:beta-glucosidase
MPSGPVAGRVTVPVTGDRYAYEDVSAPVTMVAGSCDVYLVFHGGMRISEFQFMG